MKNYDIMKMVLVVNLVISLVIQNFSGFYAICLMAILLVLIDIREHQK